MAIEFISCREESKETKAPLPVYLPRQERGRERSRSCIWDGLSDADRICEEMRYNLRAETAGLGAGVCCRAEDPLRRRFGVVVLGEVGAWPGSLSLLRTKPERGRTSGLVHLGQASTFFELCRAQPNNHNLKPRCKSDRENITSQEKMSKKIFEIDIGKYIR